MKRYLRFGEIPAGGRSINFMKLSFDQNSSFHYSISGGFVESAYAKIPESALEPGISCFDLDADGNPVLDNIRLVCSFCARLGGGKDCDGVPIMPDAAYIIEGEEAGRGNDGEPLVSNARIVERLDYDPEKMLDFAIAEMKKNFKNSEYRGREEERRTLLDSFVELKVNRKTGEKVSYWEKTNWKEYDRISYKEYLLGGWAFSDPVCDFGKL